VNAYFRGMCALARLRERLIDRIAQDLHIRARQPTDALQSTRTESEGFERAVLDEIARKRLPYTVGRLEERKLT
jgi:hypothetical protein